MRLYYIANTDFWNFVIKLDGKFSFSKYVDRLTGIDPNAPTIIGTAATFYYYYYYY